MSKNNEYTFEYNVESSNDYLGKYDLKLLMKATVQFGCPGIAPLLCIELMQNDITAVCRVKNMLLVMHQCQTIAAEHFASVKDQKYNINEMLVDHFAQVANIIS